MKKLLFASLLTAAVVFAQATGGSTGKPSTETSKTKTKTKHGKKGDKSKKGSGGTTTPAPK